MENINEALNNCVEYVKATWQSVVMGDDHAPPDAPTLKFDSMQQRQQYADSIIEGENLDVPAAGFFNRAVITTSKLGEETELGKPAWDMKPYLLNYKGNGTKARLGKNGRYNVIPFRHGVPNNMGANSTFKQMPKDIYEAAKQLRPTTSKKVATDLFGTEHYSKILKYGDRLSGTEKNHPRRTKTFLVQEGPSVKLKTYKHKTGIFEGMLKVTAPYEKAVQSQYMTFRTVSDRSDPNSWWHPGRKSQPHVQWVSEYCRPKVEKRIMEAARLDLKTAVDVEVGMRVVADR